MESERNSHVAAAMRRIAVCALLALNGCSSAPSTAGLSSLDSGLCDSRWQARAAETVNVSGPQQAVRDARHEADIARFPSGPIGDPACSYDPKNDGVVLASHTTSVGDPGLQNGAALTVAEVLQATLQRHPLLRVRQHEVDAARAELIEARLLPNPQFVTDVESETEGDNDTKMTTRLTMEIATGPKRRLRTAAAQCGVRASERALDSEVIRVLAEASDAATDVLYWQELTDLQRKLREIAAQAAEVQKERFKIGATDYRKTVQADLALADAVFEERNVRVGLQLAQVRLAAAMGTTGEEMPAIRGNLTVTSLPAISLQRVLAQARCVAPELAQRHSSVAQDFQQLALERWKAVPDVTLGPRFQHSFADKPNEAGGRLSVDIPIFDRNQGGIAAGSAQLATDVAQLELAEVTAVSEVAAVYLELQAVEENLKHYDEHVLPLVQRTETALEETLQQGDIPVHEMVALLQQFGKMRKNRLDLCSRHHRLRSRLEIVLQRRLTEL